MTRLAKPAAALVTSLCLAAACGGSGSSGAGSATSVPPTAPGPTSQAPTGPQLVAQYKCGNCHSIDGTSGIGPTWKGLAGSTVKLSDGSSVTADQAYLIRSIESPDAQIVSGYQPGVMAGVVPPGTVSAADAATIAAYIETLK
jgi:hypothetical protein